MQEVEKTIIELKNKTLSLTIRDFGLGDIEIEDLLQIDMSNLLADLITWPVIFNRIGNIKAEIDNILREQQFDLSLFEAQKYEEHKKKIIADGNKATETGIEMSIKRDPKYQIKKMNVFKIQKQADIIDGLYWSAKSKDKKLEVLSVKVKPEEFEKEILDGMINSVMIKSHKSQFPDKR